MENKTKTSLENSSMDEVKLLGAWPSPFSCRVIWALKLKGISYEYTVEKVGNMSKLVLEYNPIHKKIPVLVHGGKPIVESTIILEYIEETWPEKPLLPKDPYEKAQARFWIKFMEDKFPTFFSFFTSAGEEVEKAAKDSLEVLKIIEEQGIGNKKFFGGDSIGSVDIVFGWLAHWFGMIEEAVGRKLVEPQTFPNLHGWMERFKEVDVIKENLPEYDEALVFMKGQREMFLSQKLRD